MTPQEEKQRRNRFYFGLLIICIFIAFYSGFRLATVVKVNPVIFVPMKGFWEPLSVSGTAIAGYLSIPTLIFLFLAFRSQRAELRTTREALALQKSETQASLEIMKQQQQEVIESRKTMEVQKIESAFFNMLSMLDQIVNSMEGKVTFDYGEDTETSVEDCKGRDYLNKCCTRFRVEHDYSFRLEFDSSRRKFIEYTLSPFGEHEKQLTGREFTKNEVKNSLAKEYDIFYKEHQHNLGRYFRYLFNIMKFLIRNWKDMKISVYELSNYMDLLQAQLSNDEMALLFYNAAFGERGKTKRGEEKFKKWLERYKILENIDESALIERDHHWFYPDTDFKFLKIKERKALNKYRTSLKLDLKDVDDEYE